jgi:hypothetical protein
MTADAVGSVLLLISPNESVLILSEAIFSTVLLMKETLI